MQRRTRTGRAALCPDGGPWLIQARVALDGLRNAAVEPSRLGLCSAAGHGETEPQFVRAMWATCLTAAGAPHRLLNGGTQGVRQPAGVTATQHSALCTQYSETQGIAGCSPQIIAHTHTHTLLLSGDNKSHRLLQVKIGSSVQNYQSDEPRQHSQI